MKHTRFIFIRVYITWTEFGYPVNGHWVVGRHSLTLVFLFFYVLILCSTHDGLTPLQSYLCSVYVLCHPFHYSRFRTLIFVEAMIYIVPDFVQCTFLLTVVLSSILHSSHVCWCQSCPQSGTVYIFIDVFVVLNLAQYKCFSTPPHELSLLLYITYICQLHPCHCPWFCTLHTFLKLHTFNRYLLASNMSLPLILYTMHISQLHTCNIYLLASYM